MFEHLTRLHRRHPRRTLAGFVASLAVHAGLLALLVYGVGVARRLTDPDPEPVYAGEPATPEPAPGPPGEPGEPGEATGTGGPGDAPGEPTGGEEDAGGGAEQADVGEAEAEAGDAGGAEAGEAQPVDAAPARESSADRAIRLALAGSVPAPTAPVPDTLELDRPHRIRLTLPPRALSADSALRLTDRGEPLDVRLSRVRLAVVHGRDFAVQPELPALQLADSAAPNRWRWSVTPTRPGPGELILRLDGVAVVDSVERVVTLWSARAPVVVRASPLQRASRFFARHWIWLSLLVLLALLAALLRRRRPAPAAP